MKTIASSVIVVILVKQESLRESGPLLSWQPTWKGPFHQQVCRAT